LEELEEKWFCVMVREMMAPHRQCRNQRAESELKICN